MRCFSSFFVFSLWNPLYFLHLQHISGWMLGMIVATISDSIHSEPVNLEYTFTSLETLKPMRIKWSSNEYMEVSLKTEFQRKVIERIPYTFSILCHHPSPQWGAWGVESWGLPRKSETIFNPILHLLTQKNGLGAFLAIRCKLMNIIINCTSQMKCKEIR